MIVWCDPDRLGALKETYPRAWTNGEVLEHLNDLDGKNAQGQWPLLLISDPAYMRGIDYRAPKYGLSLLMARGFSNYRDIR